MPRVALSRQEAAVSLAMSIDSFERHVQPELRLIRRGKLRLVPVAELERWPNESAESVFRHRRGAKHQPRSWPSVSALVTPALATRATARAATAPRATRARRTTPELAARWRTFPTLSAAKLWRQDAPVALRRGTMRPPTAKTIAEAAEVLIAGAHDGSILDRGGKPYKPSTARGYEQLLHAYVIPALGGWKLSELQRRDVQDFVDGVRSQGLCPRRSRTSSTLCE